jgi:hypothetical protein
MSVPLNFDSLVGRALCVEAGATSKSNSLPS